MENQKKELEDNGFFIMADGSKSNSAENAPKLKVSRSKVEVVMKKLDDTL